MHEVDLGRESFEIVPVVTETHAEIPLGLQLDTSGDINLHTLSPGDLAPQLPNIKLSMVGSWEEVKDMYMMKGKRPKVPSQKDLNRLNEWRKRTYGLNLPYLNETQVYRPPKNPDPKDPPQDKS